ncbi:MAG: hypothetical protein QUS33_09955 [Dehalococcoidia bacterium]|nr:hypothetical protein [Dehalococcoidia bacterium]
MERSWDDGTAVQHPDGLDNLERARRYFERKAGRPVSSTEAREWLDSLVDYLRTAQRWAAEAAMREASATSGEDVQMDIHMAAQGSAMDIQPLPPRRASRRIAAQGKPGKSGLNRQRDILNKHTDGHGDVHAEQAAQAGRG